jgi:hypothetical protein
METLAVGPMLRESMAVALRHWLLVVLSIAAMVVACLANTVLVTRCMFSPECMPTRVFQEASAYTNHIIWAANRCVTWLICGLAIRRILASDAGVQRASKPLRGFGRCVAYLATITVIGYLTDPLYRVLPFLFPFSAIIGLWAGYALSVLIDVCIWVYIDARFALYTTTLVSGGRAEGFLASWQRTRGYRVRLFMLFFVIEAPLYVLSLVLSDSVWLTRELSSVARALEGVTRLPDMLLIMRLPGIVEFAIYVVVTNLCCAGAFYAVYKRFAALSIEAQTKVFD